MKQSKSQAIRALREEIHEFLEEEESEYSRMGISAFDLYDTETTEGYMRSLLARAFNALDRRKS